MWNGKKKAVTFSYDDGVVFDRRIVEIFNRYGLKCTFNLNSGIMTGASGWEENGTKINRLNAVGLPELYKGHEVAVHCLTHADLTKWDDETVRNEILLDKQNLERMFGYEMEGMAYPYGTYNEHIADIIRECGLKYARTVWSLGTAGTPENLLTLRPSMHHSEKQIWDEIERFIKLDPDTMDKPQMLYIWGHSYEFEVHNSWERIEDICRMISGKDDIFYGTNREVLSPFYE